MTPTPVGQTNIVVPAELLIGLTSRFHVTRSKVENRLMAMTEVVRGNKDSHKFHNYLISAKMRKHRGRRSHSDDAFYSFTVSTEEWSDAKRLSAKDIGSAHGPERMRALVDALATAAANHPYEQMAEKLLAGFTETIKWGNMKTFFAVDHEYHNSGSFSNKLTDALTVDSLAAAELLLARIPDHEGEYYGLTSSFLMFGPQNRNNVRQILNSVELRDTTADTKYPTANPQNKEFTNIVPVELPFITGPQWFLGAEHPQIKAFAMLIDYAQTDGQDVEFGVTGADRNEQFFRENRAVEWDAFREDGVELNDPRATVGSTGGA